VVKAQVRESTAPNAPDWITCDGQGLKQLAQAALASLERSEAAINALNVFPVPDGDTGTNMVLTMRSAYAQIQASDVTHVGGVAHTLAHGALMGARGNSGVILSQVWRGFAETVRPLEAFDAAALARGMRAGYETAYKSIAKPVEGTILTVARAAAEAAERAAPQARSLLDVMGPLVENAREAVALTPSLLVILRDAGVVDAGGQGLYVVLDGMLRTMRGEALATEVIVQQREALRTMLDPGEDGYGYDVQFLLHGQRLNLDEVRAEISAMGECPLIVGDARTIKVHVHVHDPGVPLSYGASKGVLSDVVVENMQAQFQTFLGARSEQPAGDEQIVVAEAMPAGEIAAVAVVAGQGLMDIFTRDLGAAAVVPGGQSMNPSTENILRAIESAPSEQVVVLPNNKNVILAAEQAKRLSAKRVVVVPTRSIPEGIAAMFAFNSNGELNELAARMTEAAHEIKSGEVTTAVRAAQFNGLHIGAGQVIGLAGGELVASGEGREEVVRLTLVRMGLEDDPRHVTLYFGDSVQREEAEALAKHLRGHYPAHEFEVVAGGQPYYHYLLSLE
jgi:DAK2 domain fusion protein YloV